MVSVGEEPGEGEGLERRGGEDLVQVEVHGQGESRLGCPGDDVVGNLTLDLFQR